MSVSRSRGWLLTQSAEKMRLEDFTATLQNTTYPFVFQEEKGEGENQYRHFQCYIENPEPVRFTTIKKLFPTAHIEPRKGRRAQAYAYCTKQDTRVSGPYTGNGVIDISDAPGARTDLEALREMVLGGVPVHEIILSEPSAHRHIKYLQTLAQEVQVKSASSRLRTDLEVTYIHGSTGTGKTRWVYDNFKTEDFYRVTDYLNPWDSYRGEEILVLDEYHSQLSSQVLLNILDIYPVQLRARYYNGWGNWSKVFIISNLEFWKLYPDLKIEQNEVFEALERRIHNFVSFPQDQQKMDGLI